MRTILLFISVIFLFTFQDAISQNMTITGIVIDSSDSSPIPGANVTLKGSDRGVASDLEGKFSLSVPEDATTLVASFVGYLTQEVNISNTNRSYITISLVASASELEAVTVSTGRGVQRTFIDTPLPIDNFTSKDLQTTGQPTFDAALQYRVPSFNTVMTPVNDATSLLNPYELRNLGPSRTLILINGKRKNLSSLVYTQTSPGRGETGADLSAIPQDAIKRVEILRDGASAQYGSDAIAGVMNIILKDNFDAPTLRVTTGISRKGDGLNYSLNYNSGANLPNNGFINYHVSLSREQRMVRNAKVSLEGETDPNIGFGSDNDTIQKQIIPKVVDFLKKYPDAKNQNATADNTTARFLINMGIPLKDNIQLYSNVAYVYRKSLSFANYRVPYWKQDYGLLHTETSNGINYVPVDGFKTDADGKFLRDPNGGKILQDQNPLYNNYIGYQPTFDGDLNDYNATVGVLATSNNGWKQDVSFTTGGNKMLFTVNNTVNPSLGKNSPISFKPGGFSFHHIVGNIDISKQLSRKIFLGFGSEFRSETWQEIAGDTASYSGEGANSFPGFSSNSAVVASRYNIGAYFDFGYDINKSLYLGVTGRAEKYSDFGSANVGKFTARYILPNEKLVIRASISNGFRAPTLAQQYLSLNQASFANGNIVIQGLANNRSRQAALLQIPKLKAEKSINITGGVGINPNRNITVTLDYYYIDIKDRIVYSHDVNKPKDRNNNPDLYDLMDKVGAAGISFFINGVRTRTSGVDLVASYRNIAIGSTVLNVNVAGNYTIYNKLVGAPQVPEPIKNAGAKIFTATEEALMLTSRPKFKFIVGGDLEFRKWTFNLTNTIFGPTYYSNKDLGGFDDADKNISRLNDFQVTFSTRILTDIAASFKINSHATVSLNASNILNMVPKWKYKAISPEGKAMLTSGTDSRDGTTIKQLSDALTFNNRYPNTTYDASQFSQFGTTFLAQLIYKF